MRCFRGVTLCLSTNDIYFSRILIMVLINVFPSRRIVWLTIFVIRVRINAVIGSAVEASQKLS